MIDQTQTNPDAIIDDESPICPKCGAELWRQSVHNGVGWEYGPYGCEDCKWSEWEIFDLSNGQSNIRDGLIFDQWGMAMRIENI